MRFRYKGLPVEHFRPLFGLSEAHLAARGVSSVIADAKPGFPCRVTLEDAEPGERVLLLSHMHQPASSPYRSSGPIFVREGAEQTFDSSDRVPPVLRGRLLSLRAYDGTGMMVDADIVEGNEVEGLLVRLFARDDVTTVHIHNARRGCYACAVERAG
jgi:hypothetical protein